MEEELITKKELLELAGISYGALYRWKRKKLIPDEWFIHRATYTGQETFFPKEKILGRIGQIMRMKDGMSLDDIAETFSPKLREIAMTPRDAERAGIASGGSIAFFVDQKGNSGPFGFDLAFELFLFDRLLRGGLRSREDAFAAAMLVGESLNEKKDAALCIYVSHKNGVTFCVVAQENSTVYLDKDARTEIRMPVGALMSEFKQILNRHDV